MKAHHSVGVGALLLAAIGCSSAAPEPTGARTSNLALEEEDSDEIPAPNAGRSSDFEEESGCSTPSLGTFPEGSCFGASTCKDGAWVHDWCEH